VDSQGILPGALIYQARSLVYSTGWRPTLRMDARKWSLRGARAPRTLATAPRRRELWFRKWKSAILAYLARRLAPDFRI